MNYAFVENGKIVEYPRALPNGWRNISGLCFMADADLIKLGWLPHVIVDNGGEVQDGSTFTVEANRVVETKNYRAKTAAEVNNENSQKAASVRDERNKKLSECDWTQIADAPLTGTQKAAWAAYRQSLRAIPEQAQFPNNIVWPTAP